jgi:hypothetical protein
VLLGLASAVTLGPMSHRTRDHMTLSHIRLGSLSFKSPDILCTDSHRALLATVVLLLHDASIGANRRERHNSRLFPLFPLRGMTYSICAIT